MGIKASNTAEVFFDDVKIPIENVLGGNIQFKNKLKKNKDFFLILFFSYVESKIPHGGPIDGGFVSILFFSYV